MSKTHLWWPNLVHHPLVSLQLRSLSCAILLKYPPRPSNSAPSLTFLPCDLLSHLSPLIHSPPSSICWPPSHIWWHPHGNPVLWWFAYLAICIWAMGVYALPTPQAYSPLHSSIGTFTPQTCSRACLHPHHCLPLTVRLTQHWLLHCLLYVVLMLSLPQVLTP